MSNVRSQSPFLVARTAVERLGVAVAVCAVVAMTLVGGPTPAEAESPAPNQTIAAYEVTFLKQMTVHHHMAVMMSEVCVERAGELRAELVDLCQQIIETQHHEIAMMQSWLGEWYGITGYNPHHEMGAEMMEMIEMMRAMSPMEFERFFLEDMIVHHSAALQPARQCKGKAYHEELQDLCQGIVETQVAEIRQMRAWLCHWFNECNYFVDPHRRKAMHG